MGCCCSFEVLDEKLGRNINEEEMKPIEYYPYCFIKIKELEIGATSSVWKAKDFNDNKYICKKIKKTHFLKAKREIRVLKEIVSEGGIHFPQYVYSHYDNLYCNIFLKDVNGIDLFKFLTTKPTKGIVKLKLLKKMLICINSLHKMGYVHLDIKLENFVIYNDYKVILIDFGCCHDIIKDNNEKKLNIEVGTIGYNAPEIYRFKYHNTSDYWSWAICIWILVLDKSPFTFNIPKEELKLLFKFPKEKHLKEMECMNDSQRELFLNIFTSSKDRYNFKNIIENEWIKSI